MNRGRVKGTGDLARLWEAVPSDSINNYLGRVKSRPFDTAIPYVEPCVMSHMVTTWTT